MSLSNEAVRRFRIDSALRFYTAFRHHEVSVIVDIPALCAALLIVVDELVSEAAADFRREHPAD
jgi:hypothetical protein